MRVINLKIKLKINKTFKKLILENPICSEHANFELAFHGSFLPIPTIDLFKTKDEFVIVDKKSIESTTTLNETLDDLYLYFCNL